MTKSTGQILMLVLSCVYIALWLGEIGVCIAAQSGSPYGVQIGPLLQVTGPNMLPPILGMILFCSDGRWTGKCSCSCFSAGWLGICGLSGGISMTLAGVMLLASVTVPIFGALGSLPGAIWLLPLMLLLNGLVLGFMGVLGIVFWCKGCENDKGGRWGVGAPMYGRY